MAINNKRIKKKCIITGKFTSRQNKSGDYLSLEGEEIMKRLEDKVEKNLVISDLHIPFQDKKAVNCMFNFTKDYQPSRIIINGDLIDFYSLSTFDKCPDRRNDINDELEKSKVFLEELRNIVGKKCEIYYIQGNHESRLQRFLWANPELSKLDALKLPQLLDFTKYKINNVKVNRDYWSNEGGEIKIGDLIVMHGDARLNGSKYSQNPGYSIFNTLKNRGSENMIIGHTHRLAQIYNRMGGKSVVGIECGCLCKTTRENWQQGFATFENSKSKTFNHKIYRIINGQIK